MPHHEFINHHHHMENIKKNQQKKNENMNRKRTVLMLEEIFSQYANMLKIISQLVSYIGRILIYFIKFMRNKKSMNNFMNMKLKCFDQMCYLLSIKI